MSPETQDLWDSYDGAVVYLATVMMGLVDGATREEETELQTATDAVLAARRRLEESFAR